MRNFDRGRRGGGGRGFGRRDSGGGRFDRPREMTKVICSNCGKETEVPFKPTGDRPVYCRDCFAKMGGDRNDSRPSFRKSEDRGQTSNNNAQLDAINSKLDQLIKLLTPSTSSGQAPKEEAKVDEQVPAVVRSASSGQVKTRSKISGREKRASKKAPETPEEV